MADTDIFWPERGVLVCKILCVMCKIGGAGCGSAAVWAVQWWPGAGWLCACLLPGWRLWGFGAAQVMKHLSLMFRVWLVWPLTSPLIFRRSLMLKMLIWT